MKKIDKILTQFGDALCKKIDFNLILIFLLHVVHNLTMECTPQCMHAYSKEIGLHAQILSTILGSIVNTIRVHVDLHEHLKS